MTDASANIVDSDIEDDVEFLLRFLNSGRFGPRTTRPPIENVISSLLNTTEIDSSFNSIFRPPRVRRPPLSRRRELGYNPLFNHPVPGPPLHHLNNLDPNYGRFISQLFRMPMGSSGRRNINSILQQSLMDPSQDMYKKVLSDEGENDIKKVIYKPNEFPNDSCPMTLNNFSEGDEVAQLPCGHIFEYDAVLKWLKDENATCPVCREPLSSKEVKKDLFREVTDSSGNLLRSRRRRTLPPPPRNLIVNLMEQRMRQEEEEELQAAIMESLRMSNENQNNNDDDEHPKSD